MDGIPRRLTAGGRAGNCRHTDFQSIAVPSELLAPQGEATLAKELRSSLFAQRHPISIYSSKVE